MTTEPYCGPPPLPEELWQSWNLDPWLLPGAIGAIGLCYLLSSAQRTSDVRPVPAGAAFLVLMIAFVSPLCALTTALYSARILHHVLLVAAAAPLVALALPAGRLTLKVPLSAWFLLHTMLMWLWHAPVPYAFAISSHGVYWAMEASLFFSALFLWQGILAQRAHPGAAMAALLGSIIQMGMLGALFTFASRPLYEPHFGTTLPFGLTPLADQQLAGLILWVPAALPYLAAALLIVLRFLDRQARDEPA